jgi:prevent-host-death family protein
MRVVGIKTLKNKLREYVRIAPAGERVLITDRDRLVAELVPPQPSIAEVVRPEAVGSGLSRPPIRPVNGPPARIGGMTFGDVMTSLDEDRADRTGH